MITIIAFILILGILVFVHELGHFTAARKNGIKAQEFGFGFPPRFFGLYRDVDNKWKISWGSKDIESKDTIYSLNWIPIGGFVSIKGEDGNNTDADSFATKAVWRRFTVLVAGVAMNIVLATVLLCIGLMIGLPRDIEGLNIAQKYISQEKLQIIQVEKDSPADKAGVQLADQILTVNDIKPKNITDIQQLISTSGDKTIKMVVSRDKNEKVFNIETRYDETTKTKRVGIAMSHIALVRYPWYQAIWEGIKTTLYLIKEIFIALYELLYRLVIGQSVGADVAGPIGIAVLTGQVVDMGWSYILQFVALLSINLAIVNILPFPALDGGRIVFLIIEKIRRKPVNQKIEGIVHSIGFGILMILILLVTYKDITRWGGAIWAKIVSIF